jgi:FKBP-type peptidyl-prolyl cis-trans isomerase FklB
MRHSIVGLALLALLAAPAFSQDEKKPASLIEKVSYSIGLRMGQNFSGDGIEVDLSWLTQGIEDGLKKDAKPLLTDKESREAMIEFQKDLQAKQLAKAEAAGKKNKQEGDAFLAANKKKDGVKATDSGLQYKVVKKGDGATPKATDTVKVHYHGTLIDGTVFDSSVERGEPAQFPVNRVIPGWTEALQLMKVGDKYQLYIPSDLAYGERGAGGDIGPNSVLIFDVELLDIVK